MQSNQEDKGKGMKDGRDGDIGTPDMADAGNLQQQTGQPGNQQGQRDSQGRQADALRGGPGDRQLGERQTSQDEVGTARPRNDPTPNG